MLRICCIFILVVTFVRWIIGPNKNSQDRINYLLLSALMQTLMFDAPKFMNYDINDPDIVLPFANSVGIYFPTLISLIILFVNLGKKRRYALGNFKYVFIIMLLSLVYSYYTPYNTSIRATNIYCLMVGQVLLVYYICKICIPVKTMQASTYDAFRIIIFVQFFISFVVLFLGLYSFQDPFLGSDRDSTYFDREGASLLVASGTTSQHNFLGGLCAFIAVFFYCSYLYKFRRRQSFLLFIISFVTLLFSQARGALIACSLSLVFLYLSNMFREGRLGVKKVLLFLVVVVVLLLLFIQIPIVHDMFFNSDVEDMANARLYHVLMAYDIIIETKGQGVGLNTHVIYMLNRLTTSDIGQYFFERAIHNMYLIVVVELGFIGFFAYIYYIISRIWKFIKIHNMEMRSPVLCSTFICMLVIISVHGMLDMLYFRYQYLMMLFLFGVFCDLNYKKSIESVKRRKYENIDANCTIK